MGGTLMKKEFFIYNKEEHLIITKVYDELEAIDIVADSDDSLDYYTVDALNYSWIPIFIKEQIICWSFLFNISHVSDIDSILVQGGGDKKDGGHVWNQIYFKNKWYNADVTSASYNITNNIKVNTFLVKDDDLNYKTTSLLAHKCNDNYNMSNAIRRK